MLAQQISLAHAKEDKLFYFVANVIIYRPSDGRCLILKRDIREKVHPGKFAVPGGKLEWGDIEVGKETKLNGDVRDFDSAIEDLLRREAKEEAGVDIEGPFVYLRGGAFIRPDGVPVVLVKFAARYVSGVVVPEAGAFTEYAWVNSEEVKAYECIQKIDEEIAEAIAHFSKS